MKKIWKNVVLFVLGLIILPIGMADAKLPPEQVAIGGITYKASIDYVISIYGQPHRVKSDVYYWGDDDSLKITTWDPAKGQTNYVTSVTCSAANGLETPIGISVDMDYGALLRYGSKAGDAPDYIDYDNGTYAYISSNGCLIYRVKNEKIVSIEIVGHLS